MKVESFQELAQQVDRKTAPTHVGIIMDGNRRWAEANNLKAIYGHKKGYERLRELVDVCDDFGIKYLTVYAFSSENLKKRSEIEKKFLFELLRNSIQEVINDSQIMEKGVRVNFFGRWHLLPEDLQNKIKELIHKTENNNNFFMNVCLVYDGQDEIVDAVKSIVDDVITGKKKIEDIDRDFIKANLYTKNIPAPDLIIRTGMKDEKRLSGFLLWDSSYSEFFFTEVLWPDFDNTEFAKAIVNFQQRKRRFGK